MDRKISTKIFIFGIICFGGFNLSFGESLCDITLWYSKQSQTGIFEGELTHDQRSVQLIAEDLIRKSEHIPQEKFVDCSLLDKYEILLWGNQSPQSTDGVHSANGQNEVDESEIDETEMFEEDEETEENAEKQQESASEDVKNEQQNGQQGQEINKQHKKQEAETQQVSGLSGVSDTKQQEGGIDAQQERQEVETKETKNMPKQEEVMERKVEAANTATPIKNGESDGSLNGHDGSMGVGLNENIKVNKEETIDQADDNNMQEGDSDDDTKQEISEKENVVFGHCRTGMTAMLDVFDLMMKDQHKNLYSYKPKKQICPQFTEKPNFVYSPSACLTAYASSVINKAEKDQNNMSESKQDIEKDKDTTLSNGVEKEHSVNKNILNGEITSNIVDQPDIPQTKRQDAKHEETDETQKSANKNNESKQKEEMTRANEAAEDAARNLKEYFNRKSDEYSIKIQSLEITLMKLQNQVLMEKLEKQNHTSTITRLENHILKLENELLKINQSYYTLKSENEAMDRRQRKYLELGHTGAKEQDAKQYEIISKQQEKIAQLKEILNNQTSAIDKIRSRSDHLEDQNRMLYQMIMNQTTLMSQIMSRVQTLTEENIKQREEARQLRKNMDEKIMTSNILQTNQKLKQDQESNELLNNLNILTTDNKELKIKSNAQIPLTPVINYRWCGKKAVNCLSEITAAVICSPLSPFQWAQCDTTYFNMEEDPPIPNANVAITQEQKDKLAQKQKDKQNAEKDTTTSSMHDELHAQMQQNKDKNLEKINQNISDGKLEKIGSESKQAPDLPDPQDTGEKQKVNGTPQTGDQIKDQPEQEHGEHRPNLPVDQEQAGQTKNQEEVIEQTKNINKQESKEVPTEQVQAKEQKQDQTKQVQHEKISNGQPKTNQNDQVTRKTENQPAQQLQEKEIQRPLPGDENVNTDQKNNQINEQQLTSEQNQKNTQTLSKQEEQSKTQQDEQTVQQEIKNQNHGQKKNEDISKQKQKEDQEKNQPKQEQRNQQQDNKDQTQSQQQNEQKIQQQGQTDDKQGKKVSTDDKASNKETQKVDKEQATQGKASKKVLQKKPLLYSNLEQREPKDCYDHYINRGSRRNGAYRIRPMGQKTSIEVFCDMKNGGWTVLQKRQDGTTNFYRDWRDYKEGFGGVYGEQWIGLDYLHHMTNQDYYTLRIDLIDWNKQAKFADYGYFVVDDEDEGYRLHIGEYSGDAGDGMGKHNQHKFSTRDVDNDKIVKEFGGSCAKRFTGAWWYYKCYMSNLNGKYYRGGKIPEKKFDGITWKPWTGPNYSMKIVVMKIRPNSAK